MAVLTEHYPHFVCARQGKFSLLEAPRPPSDENLSQSEDKSYRATYTLSRREPASNLGPWVSCANAPPTKQLASLLCEQCSIYYTIHAMRCMFYVLS